MLRTFKPFYRRLLLRFHYPVSMPDDIAKDLGFSFPRYLSFKEFISHLLQPDLRPAKLRHLMPREKAEEIFQAAVRKEKFRNNSLFSYHFKRGWMEFILQFDEHSRLRRLYVRHKELKQKIEIRISQ